MEEKENMLNIFIFFTMKHTFLFLFGVIVTSSLFFISCNDNNNTPDFTETLPEPEPEPLPIILPIPEVYITTPENVGITSKTTWVKNSSIKIIDEYGEEHNINTSIKGRGNSTWNYPKKPYAIKLDSKEEVLGMPKHKRWVLLANWMDRTLLRNDVSFEIARRIMAWAPRGKFVELYLNGEHKGNYYLCEQIKVDKNRVNIDELDKKTNFNDATQITGGYILEFDTNNPKTGEINYFYSRIKNYPVTIKEPDEEVITSSEHPGFLYIQEYINNLEQLFEDDKKEKARWSEIEKLIDVRSFIDWWLVHEVVRNGEALAPKSCYMYKQKNDKLYAGPIWDCDWGTFRLNNDGLVAAKALYYEYLFKYQEFKIAVKERYAEVRETLADIDNYIQKQADLVETSNEINFAKWPITQFINGDENMTFDEAIETMRSALKRRLNLVDSYISSL